MTIHLPRISDNCPFVRILDYLKGNYNKKFKCVKQKEQLLKSSFAYKQGSSILFY